MNLDKYEGKRNALISLGLITVLIICIVPAMDFVVAQTTRKTIDASNIVLTDDLNAALANATKTSSLPWDNITDTAPIGPYNFMISTFTNDTATYYQATNGTDGKILDSWTSTDATTVLNNAMGSHIKLSDGNFSINGHFSPTANTWIEGNGIGKTWLVNIKSNDRVLLNANPMDPSWANYSRMDSNIKINDLSVDSSIYDGEAFNFVSAQDITVQNVNFYGNVTTGCQAIDTDNCVGVLIDKNHFSDFGGAAVHFSDSYSGLGVWSVHPSSMNNTVQNNLFLRCGSVDSVGALSLAYIGSGTQVWGASYNRAFNNFFMYCYIGIDLTNSYLNTYGNIIDHNYFINCTKYSIKEYGVGGTQITFNTINCTLGGQGIYVGSSSYILNNTLVQGNIVSYSGGGDSSTTYEGILLYNAQHCIVSNNFVSNNGGAGIGLNNGTGKISAYNIISNNQMWDNSLGKITGYSYALQDYGVREQVGSDYNKIHDNTVTDARLASYITLGTHTSCYGDYNATTWLAYPSL